MKWFKDGKEIKPSDTRFLMTNDGGDCKLTIKQCELEDAGKYTCKIEEFGTEGNDECTCDLTVGEFPHKFSSQLEGKNLLGVIHKPCGHGRVEEVSQMSLLFNIYISLIK